MTSKRFTLQYINEQHISANVYDNGTFIASVSIGEELLVEVLNQLVEENEQLKQFIEDLATKGTGRIDLANGYSYNIKAILTDFNR